MNHAVSPIVYLLGLPVGRNEHDPGSVPMRSILRIGDALMSQELVAMLQELFDVSTLPARVLANFGGAPGSFIPELHS